MAGISTIGQLILWLNERAREEGRIEVSDPVASLVIETLEGDGAVPDGRFRDLPLGVQVGLELRRGRAFSDEAKAIRSAALARLRDYEVFLAAIDALGYTPQLVRAALSIHFERLLDEELGTAGNCVLLDIETARQRAPEDIQQAVDLLPRMGPQDIGVELDTNGSRLVGRAMATMSRILEGRYNGKPRKRRRRKAKAAS